MRNYLRRKERYKEMKSDFDAKKNTEKSMHTTEIETENRSLLDKEEEEPREVTKHEKTKIPKEKPP
jgi:hypothetical protein